jgi:tetratricopeptide (TPR) repeat protein
VPGRVRRLLQRGLSQRPEERPADLDTVVAALAARPWRLVAAAAAVVILGAAIVAINVGVRVGASQACAGGKARLEAVWNVARRGAAARAFTASGAPQAADVWARTDATLGQYAGAWGGAYVEACEAARVRGEQSEVLLDRRMDCLDGHLRDLDALLASFASATPDTVDRAIQAAYDLRPLASCADRARLLATSPPPDTPGAAALLGEARDHIARARAARAGLRYDEALRQADAAVEVARHVGDLPLAAQALVEIAQAREAQGGLDLAERAYDDAIDSAVRSHDDMTAAEAMTGLLDVLGSSKKSAQALAVAPLVSAQVARAGEDPVQRAHYFLARGKTRDPSDQGVANITDNLMALGLLESVYAPDDPRLGPALAGVARALWGAPRFGEAVYFDEKSYQLALRSLGEDHPDTVLQLMNLALSLRLVGRIEESRVKAAAAVAACERGLCPGDHELRALYVLAAAQEGEGHYDDELATVDRALRLVEAEPGAASQPAHGLRLTSLLMEQSVGLANLGRTEDALAALARATGLPEPPRTWAVDGRAVPTTGSPAFELLLGDALEEGGRREEAEVRYREARDLVVANFPTNNDLGDALDGIARADERRGRYQEALAGHERSRQIIEISTLVDTPYALSARIGAVRCRLALGDLAGARTEAEAALALAEASHVAPAIVAEARFVFARCLAASQEDHRRAAALARDALLAMPGRTVRQKEMQSEIRAWIARCERPLATVPSAACAQVR